jgi:transcription antitermination factor NusA-like protein
MSIATILRVSPDTSLPILRAQLNEVKDNKEEILKKINEPDEFGDTPLHIAAAAGKLLTVKFLVSSGANVNAKNLAGSTPLHKAMLSGFGKPIVDFLLENKAEWTTNDSGFTPFTYAKDILRDQKQFFFTLLEKETKKPAKMTMKVSANYLPIIIGKGGKMLENIRAETQTDVEVPDRRNRSQNESEPVEIHLTARNEKELEQGKKKIEKLMEKQDQEKKKIEKLVETQDQEKKKEEEDFYWPIKSTPNPQSKEAPKPIKKEPEDYNIKKKELAGKKKNAEEPLPAGKNASAQAPTTEKQQQQQMKERNVRIPKDKHGLVIGKKGANIERIKTTYGVSVFVPDLTDQSDTITIKGTSKEALEDAKYDILQILRGGGTGVGPGGRGRGGRGGAGGNRGPGGMGGGRRYGREEGDNSNNPPPKPKPKNQKINLDEFPTLF